MNDPDHPSSCVRTQGIRSLLLVLAPATLASAPLEAFARLGGVPWIVAATISAALAVAGFQHRRGEARSRGLATVAFLVWAVGTLVEHAHEPARGYLVLLGVVAFTAYLWPADRLRAVGERADHGDRGVVVAAGIGALFGLEAWQTSATPAFLESAALTATYAVAPVLALRSSTYERPWQRVLLWTAAALATLPLVEAGLGRLGAALPPMPFGWFSPLILIGLVGRRAVLRRPVSALVPGEPGMWDTLLVRPSRVLVISFLGICTVGTLLLGLPVASSSGRSLSWLDAAFTAVSATCVTGLIVVDTPNAFGGFGQAVVLGLIQVGGLGIMVFSAAAIVLLGRRLSLSHERAAVDLVGAGGRSGLKQAVRWVLTVTFLTEAVAALLLAVSFHAHGDDWATAGWRGLFTAISAFCNAGFALQSDSLVPYAGSPFVLSVIGVTIVVGGLGPPVVAALAAWKDPSRRSLHASLVLWATAVLLVVPALLIAALEWGGTLAGMSPGHKLLNAGFQSVTLRTAGFNSIDLTQVHPATRTVMILTMFVGGSPGSTAGGVKTTTVAVVLLAIVAVARGRKHVEAFGRTLPISTVMRAAAVTILAALGACAALTAVQLTQTIPLDVALFEVVSALATVGLSVGGTAALDEVGKLIVIACMFAGRVGPLTLFVFLASRTRADSTRRYPEEPVPIG